MLFLMPMPVGLAGRLDRIGSMAVGDLATDRTALAQQLSDMVIQPVSL